MVRTYRFQIATRGDNDLVAITDRVESAVRSAGLTAGTATVFVRHSTAAIATTEYEPGLLADLQAAVDRLVPRDLPYRHNLAPGEDNGHAHVRAALFGPSLVVPFADGRLLLGTWQQIVLADFDTRPREREIVVQVIGE
jgi:secondary thiamine-phosphate synthase enzyme